MFQEHQTLREKELEMGPKASPGYGGKFGVEQDRMDKVSADPRGVSPGVLDLARVSRVVSQPSPSVEKLGIHLLRARFARSNSLSIDLSREGLWFLEALQILSCWGGRCFGKPAAGDQVLPEASSVTRTEAHSQPARLLARASRVVQAAALVVPICSPEPSFSAWFHVEAGKSAT